MKKHTKPSKKEIPIIGEIDSKTEKVHFYKKPKPKYNIEEIKNSIIRADCMKALPQIPDKSIDYCIIDFPYNISNYKNNLTKRGGKIVKAEFGKWDVWNNMDDYLNWVFKVSKEIQRVLKPLASTLFFFDSRQAGWIAYELERRGIFVYKSPIIWVKNNPIPHCRKTGFRSSFEHAIWLINSQEKYIGNGKIVIKPKTFNFQEQQEMMNVMRYNIGQKFTTHSTEKPLNLTERFISIFTNENDVVLDPMCGSGTTCVAAKRLKRNYIGIEISEEYCKMSEQRISSQTEPLF